MEYELIIEKGKAKSLIAFLKQLDFVKVNPLTKKSIRIRKPLSSKKNPIPYFNAKSGWDIDANILRNQSVRKTDKW